MASRSRVLNEIVALLMHTGADRKEGRTQAEISAALEIDRSTVSRTLRTYPGFAVSRRPIHQTGYYYDANQRLSIAQREAGARESPDYSDDLATGLEPALSASPAFIEATKRLADLPPEKRTREFLLARSLELIPKMGPETPATDIAVFYYTVALALETE